MRMRSFRSRAKQGLFSLGGVLLTFTFLTSLLTHVVVVVALGYYSVYLTTVPLLVASSIIFLAKSCVDKEFKKWRLGPKLTHCPISTMFWITMPRPETKEDNKEEKSASRITTKVKVAGNELFFCFLLHLFILTLGAVAFAVLNLDPDYTQKMRKLEEVFTISMASMVYIACPLALLLSMASQVVYRQHCDPRKPIRIRSGCCPGSFSDCKPLPRSEIVQTAVQLKEEVEETEAVAAELQEIFRYIKNHCNENE